MGPAFTVRGCQSESLRSLVGGSLSVGVAPQAHAPAPPPTTLGSPPGWPRRELLGDVPSAPRARRPKAAPSVIVSDSDSPSGRSGSSAAARTDNGEDDATAVTGPSRGSTASTPSDHRDSRARPQGRGSAARQPTSQRPWPGSPSASLCPRRATAVRQGREPREAGGAVADPTRVGRRRQGRTASSNSERDCLAITLDRQGPLNRSTCRRPEDPTRL